MPSRIAISCPAKVNLSLRVHARRRDGFHEVSTVLQTIGLCDRLTLHRTAGAAPLRIDVPGGGAPADGSNLVLRAARAFFAAVGEPARGVRFELEKRIPAGSGLGGGSSDAAASLALLQRLRGNPLDRERLRAVAAAVGSDVPFFLAGGTALATGRGEKVTPLDDLPETPVLVAVPAVEVSTAEVYRAWTPASAPRVAVGGSGSEDPRTQRAGRPAHPVGSEDPRTRWGDCPPLPPPSLRGDAAGWVLGNDLAPVVRRLHPEVDRLLRVLERRGRPRRRGGPQVSGSGGAVFAIGEWPGAERALAGMNARVFRTRTLPRSRGQWT